MSPKQTTIKIFSQNNFLINEKKTFFSFKTRKSISGQAINYILHFCHDIFDFVMPQDKTAFKKFQRMVGIVIKCNVTSHQNMSEIFCLLEKE